ncbi:MAG: hypothetical protein QM487_11265 [Candidatus Marithrix sp.]
MKSTYTREDFIQQVINEYKTARIPAKNVFTQSFFPEDIYYLINNEPEFAKQGVLLDGRYYTQSSFNPNNPATWLKETEGFVNNGVQYISPPIWVLITLDVNKNIIPSEYAKSINDLGLNIISWTSERSGPLKTNYDGFYYQSIKDIIQNDGIVYEVLDVLNKDVGIKGIFSDWPAITTYYANCMGL